jgi:hypothetical protein
MTKPSSSPGAATKTRAATPAFAPRAWARLDRTRRACACGGKCGNIDVLVPRPGESLEPTRSSSLTQWWTQDSVASRR